MGEPITAELAWRMRQRGFVLATDRQYEDEAITAIAKRQEELMASKWQIQLEMDKLDSQIRQIAKK
ncbi:MAG: hypothetical protein WC919_05255 [Candidatus Paceibacterota bacterium]|jgi:hypothetical protein